MFLLITTEVVKLRPLSPGFPAVEVISRLAWFVIVVAGLLVACVIMRRQSREKFNEFLVPALLTAALTAGLSVSQLPPAAIHGFFEGSGAAPAPLPQAVAAPALSPPVFSASRGWKRCEGIDVDTLRASGSAPGLSVEMNPVSSLIGDEAEALSAAVLTALQARTDRADVRLRITSVTLREERDSAVPSVFMTLRWIQRTGTSRDVNLSESVVVRGSSVASARDHGITCAATAVAVRAAGQVATSSPVPPATSLPDNIR